ncbi:putative ribonuclease H protein [Sesbania bispinosa]|nr:putative ribonuclease H protein [Sesbania bispinosa]
MWTVAKNGAVGDDWCLIFGLTIWHLWRRRNEVVFQNVEVDTDTIISRVQSLANLSNSVDLHSSRAVRSSEQWVRWSSPEEGWFKFNVDGSVNIASKKAGCGGILRVAILVHLVSLWLSLEESFQQFMLLGREAV